jgi:hypothetical protein
VRAHEGYRAGRSAETRQRVRPLFSLIPHGDCHN